MVIKINLKQQTMFYAFIFIFLLCAATTCKKNNDCPDGSHKYIEIKNNSSITVNWIKDDNPNDSIWTNNGSTYPSSSKGLIYPNSSYQAAAGLAKCWEYFYQGGHSEYYFIFHHDTVQALGWQAISGTNRGLLKRVKVDLNYLKNNDFSITYP
jgi:hypothetical protein